MNHPKARSPALEHIYVLRLRAPATLLSSNVFILPVPLRIGRTELVCEHVFERALQAAHAR